MKALEKRRIPRMETQVTFMGFGALEIGRNWGIGQGDEVKRPEEEDASKVLNSVLGLGINLIDTASAYHKSEERIGKYISGRRKEYILASKCGEHNNEPATYYDFSYKAVSESIDKSLRLLKTDSIDLMQIHFGPQPEEVIERGETVEAMKAAQKAGKIKYLGASIDGELAARCIKSGDFDVVQMTYNLLDTRNKANIELAKERGIGVFIRFGLALGSLTSRVIPHLNENIRNKEKIVKLLELVNNDGDMLTSLALNFLYENDGISSVLIGSKNIAHIKADMELLERPVDGELLKQAVRIGAEG